MTFITNWSDKKNIDYALDKIDDRDYIFEEMSWLSNKIKKPESRIIDREDDYQNQGLKEITAYMCVFYSSWHWSNIQNFSEDSNVFINNESFWKRAIKEKLLDPKKWAYIQSWPKLLKIEKYIKWYALVKTLNGIKDSILNGNPICVWSNKIDWSWTKDNYNIAVKWNSYWHAFLIIWYNDKDKLIILKNSYWKDFWDNWVFYIRYEDIFSILYNGKYSLIDVKEPIVKYKRDILKKINLHDTRIWFLIGLTNWKNLSQEKEEAVAMDVRVIRMLDKDNKKIQEAEHLLNKLK